MQGYKKAALSSVKARSTSTVLSLKKWHWVFGLFKLMQTPVFIG
jgi:hypothetical protein